MGCLVAILFVVTIGLFSIYPIQSFFITILLIIIGVLFSVAYRKNDEQKERLEEETIARIRHIYKDLKSQITIPEDSLRVNYKKGFAKLLQATNYIWTQDDMLCFFPAQIPHTDSPENIGRIILHQIPLDRIEYFSTRGDLVYENKIIGGGGGGSSLGGAVLGGVVAGEAGAVIGSRKKREPIESTMITHDNRETFLNYFDDDDKRRTMFFEFKDFNTFNDLIPEKEYGIVNTIKTNELLNKANSTEDIILMIRELAKLKDEGFLTEEEFTDKKKQLLDQIH